MKVKSKILIVEDERPIHNLIAQSLGSEDYLLYHAYSAPEGIQSAATQQPDLIIVDLGLPKGHGLDVISAVRSWSSVLPIIVLSALDDEQTKVLALDAGANDYVTKPFSMLELGARIRVLLRSVALSISQTSELSAGPFLVKVVDHIVLKENREIHLTPTEFNLFLILIRNANRVIPHRQLLREVWGPNSVNDTQYLRVFMKTLREKIEDVAGQPRYILTEPGIGYRFKVSSESRQ